MEGAGDDRAGFKMKKHCWHRIEVTLLRCCNCGVFCYVTRKQTVAGHGPFHPDSGEPDEEGLGEKYKPCAGQFLDTMPAVRR